MKAMRVLFVGVAALAVAASVAAVPLPGMGNSGNWLDSISSVLLQQGGDDGQGAKTFGGVPKDKSDHFTGPSIMTSEELGQPQKQPYGSETDETELTPDNEGLPGPGIRGLTSESGDAVAKLEQAILDSSLSEVKKSEFLQLVAQIKDSPSNSASFDHEQLSPAPSNEPNAGSEKDATDPKYQLISMALSAMMGSSNQSSQAPGSGGSGGTAQLIQSILSQFAKPPAPGASS